MATQQKASRSFLKKRTKKLLLNCGLWHTLATTRSDQKFFCFFFFKKRSASLLSFAS
jgi:hypothetical protein